MRLTPFPLISRAIWALGPPKFAWEGEDPADTIGEVSDDYIDQFAHLNPVAAVAYVLCCVEWIYWFVRDNFDHHQAVDYEQFLMALWVWECGLPRRAPPQVYRNRNPGAAKRTVFKDAVEVGLDTATDSIASVRDNESAVDAAFITQLCEYVLPMESGFDSWRGEVYDRLVKRFPDSAQPYMGVRVARELFDTDLAYDTLDNDAACVALVEAYNIEPNRYLPLKTPN